MNQRSIETGDSVSGHKNPAIFLPLSLRFAKEDLTQLCKIRGDYSETQIQESKELTIIHRALWTALIVEIRKLFEDSRFENYSLRKIDFFQREPYKSVINRIYGDQIIQKILTTGYTFTTHLGKDKTQIFSTAGICSSKLKELLTELQGPVNAFEKSLRDNKSF